MGDVLMTRANLIPPRLRSQEGNLGYGISMAEYVSRTGS